jgi:hypothetical protein
MVDKIVVDGAWANPVSLWQLLQKLAKSCLPDRTAVSLLPLRTTSIAPFIESILVTQGKNERVKEIKTVPNKDLMGQFMLQKIAGNRKSFALLRKLKL